MSRSRMNSEEMNRRTRKSSEDRDYRSRKNSGERRSRKNSDDRSRTSSVFSKTSRSRVSNSEEDEIERYRNKIRKLNRDKEELKDNLKRLLAGIEEKNKEHRVELEKTQSYFQGQLEDEKNRTEIIKQRYEQRIKQTNGNEVQTIKRLENTIVSLQNKMKKIQEEQGMSTENEEKLKKTISKMEEYIQTMKNEYSKELQNIQKINTQELQNVQKMNLLERQELVNKMTYEKEQELMKEISSVKVEKQNILKQMEEKDKNKNDEIVRLKAELTMCKTDYERKFSEFINSGKKSVEDLNKEHESKMISREQVYKKEVEMMKKNYEKDLEILRLEKDKNFELGTINLKREIEEQKKIVYNLQKEITMYNEKTDKNIGRRNDDVKKIELELQKKEKEIVNLQLQYDKVSGESEEQILKLKDQLTHVRDNAKKMQDYAQMLNNQFIMNTNKQKELADREIYSRDQTIFQLEQQLKKIGEETIDKFNRMDRTIKTTGEDHRITSEKYNQSIITLEKQEQMLDNLRVELQKQKEINENLASKVRILDFEREKAESKLKSEGLYTEKTEKNIIELKSDIQKLKTVNDKLCESNRSLLFDKELTEKKYKIEIENKNQEVYKTKLQLDEVKVKYEKIQNLYTDTQRLCHVSKEEINTKDKIIAINNQDIENLNKKLEETIGKLSYLQTNYQKMEVKLSQQGGILSDSEKTIFTQKSQLENISRFSDEIKNKLEHVQELNRKYEIKLKEKEVECIEREKNIINAKKDMEKSNKDISYLSTEITRLRKTFADEKKQYILEFELQKEKELNDISKELSASKATILAYDQHRLQLEKDLLKLTTEKDRYKNMSDIIPDKDKAVDEFKKKIMFLEKIVVDLEKGKQEFQKKYEIELEKVIHINKLLEEKEKIVKETIDKVSVLEHTRKQQEVLKQHIEKNLESITEKYKKAIEAPDSELKNYTRDNKRLKDEISELKTTYTISVNRLTGEIKNKQSEIELLHNKVKDTVEKENKIRELNEKINTISQEYRSIIDKLHIESKKDKEEITKLSFKKSIYEQESRELLHVKEALENLKTTYDKINHKLSEEKKNEVESANKKVCEMKEEVIHMQEHIEKVRQDCIKQIQEARKLPKEDIDKLEKYQHENNRLNNLLEGSEKKILSLQSEMMQIVANVNAKNVFLKHKEDEIRKLEEEVKNTPPKLLDPSIRRERDDALSNLRQSQLELNITKEEVIQLSEKINKIETHIRALENEKQALLKTQDDLNRTLNNVQKRYERDLGQREQRIKELEGVIATYQK